MTGNDTRQNISVSLCFYIELKRGLSRMCQSMNNSGLSERHKNHPGITQGESVFHFGAAEMWNSLN